MRPNPDLCPPGVRESLERYRDDGIPVGDFLEAVLSNDLMTAFARADADNTEAMPHICAWIYNEMPRSLWGDHPTYLAHITAKYNVRAVDMMISAIERNCKP